MSETQARPRARLCFLTPRYPLDTPSNSLGNIKAPKGALSFHSLAPDETQQQTFEVILPNLIHKSKKRNLR